MVSGSTTTIRHSWSLTKISLWVNYLVTDQQENTTRRVDVQPSTKKSLPINLHIYLHCYNSCHCVSFHRNLTVGICSHSVRGALVRLSSDVEKWCLFKIFQGPEELFKGVPHGCNRMHGGLSCGNMKQTLACLKCLCLLYCTFSLAFLSGTKGVIQKPEFIQ